MYSFPYLVFFFFFTTLCIFDKIPAPFVQLCASYTVCSKNLFILSLLCVILALLLPISPSINLKLREESSEAGLPHGPTQEIRAIGTGRMKNYYHTITDLC